MSLCPICHDESASACPESTRVPLVRWTCMNCGAFAVEDQAQAVIPLIAARNEQATTNAVCFLRANPGHIISLDNAASLFTVRTPSFQYRADALLTIIASRTRRIGEFTNVSLLDPELLYGSWSGVSEECIELFSSLAASGLIETVGVVRAVGTQVKIAPAGWARLEALRDRNPGSRQGLAIVPADPSMGDFCAACILPALRDAGYDPAVLALGEELIGAEAVVQVRRSRFVVAVFGGRGAGAHYAAGLAQGLGLAVFWVCDVQDRAAFPYDPGQHACLEYDLKAPADFRRRLALSIEARLGRPGRAQADA